MAKVPVRKHRSARTRSRPTAILKPKQRP